MEIRICLECDNEFSPDRPSRWLCPECRWEPDDDPMEKYMDEQMLINIGMGD